MKKSPKFTNGDEMRRTLRIKKTIDLKIEREAERRRLARKPRRGRAADVRALALANELIERAEDEGMSVFAFLQREAAELGAESWLGAKR